MIRDLLFRPMFNSVDTFTAIICCGLMFAGYFMASIPVALAGALISHSVRLIIAKEDAKFGRYLPRRGRR